MLTVDEALDAVRDRCAALPAQRRRLAAALGCVLAEDVAADLDLPPFDKALVDGYAVRSRRPGRRRPPAADRRGDHGRADAEPAARRRRGRGDHDRRPLPAGADAVVMIEKTRRDGDVVVIDDPDVAPGQAPARARA